MNLARKIPSRDSEVMRMAVYYGFAEAFGFTPDQVDQLDNYTIEALKTIGNAKAEEYERKMRSIKR